MQVNWKALPITAAFVVLLWLAIEGHYGLAVVAVGALLFWGAPWVPASERRTRERHR